MTEPAILPVALDWPVRGCEIPARAFGPFDREALARYALVSGDDNPLHLDPSAAKAAGLSATPVHGMLLLSFFEHFIMGWRPDLFISQLSAKFLRPVLVGEGVQISGRVLRSRNAPEPELLLRLIARTQADEVAVLGEATVLAKT